jgi:hypothetical protein
VEDPAKLDERHLPQQGRKAGLATVLGAATSGQVLLYEASARLSGRDQPVARARAVAARSPGAS